MQRYIFAAAVCAAMSVHAADNLNFNPKQMQALGIRTVPLTASVQQAGLGYPATVVVPPAQQRIVAAPMMGLISRVWVTSNTPVKAGQPLATLASPSLAEAQGGLVQAAAQAQLARGQMQRDDQLLADGIIPQSRQQATRAAYLSANAMLIQQRQSLRMLGVPAATIAQMERGQANTAELNLVAPMAGVVLEVNAAAGQRVDAAAALFKIVQMKPLWLEIQVPGSDAAAIHVGDQVAVGGRKVSGHVLSVGQSTQLAQTVLVRAQIDGELDGLLSGQAVEAQLTGKTGHDWQVPVTALAYQQSKAYVFVRDASGFHPVAVQVLSQTANMARVTGKLKTNDMLAVQGVAQIKAVWTGVGGE
ncbi:MAG: efflux RND transporter periplasmic adaptor subunit [Sulfuriferula sp.]|nr:efflux RND transporter periplasmic adaptor subunit [Sulfuriferula sp.]